MSEVFCTVFTPTYNRASLLSKLYESLVVQTEKDFEWVIVDDGSSDNTEEVVIEFIEQDKFKIIYFKQKNGGKHRAINKGLELCSGKVFAIVDSDDELTYDSLEKVKRWFDQIGNVNKKFCGVAGNKGYTAEKIVGATFEGEFIDATNIERRKYNIVGDKFEIYYTEILKKYPFPTFEGEKFMSEIVVWTRMAKDGYLVRWFNDIIYIAEYQEEGLTSNNFRVLANSPKGYALRIREQVKYADLSFKEKMGYYSNYYFLIKEKKSFSEIKKDLDISGIDLRLSILLRKILILIRGEKNEYENIKN